MVSDHNTGPPSAGGAPRPQPTDLSAHVRSLPGRVLSELSVFRSPQGLVYVQQGDSGLVHAIHSPSAQTLLMQHLFDMGYSIRPRELREGIQELAGVGSITPDVREVWYRVAPHPDGFEVDLGDHSRRRVRVTPGRVELVADHGGVLFERFPSTLAMPAPADEGDWSLVKKYWNLDPAQHVMVQGWASYALAHPKRVGTTIPVLFVTGPEGSTKSTFTRTLKHTLDPTSSGLQALPHNTKDLVLATQRSHVVVFDNVRRLSAATSDILCMVASGACMPARQLYSDSAVVEHRLHAALVLNGLHYFIDQQDLAQRCLPVTLKAIPREGRLAESEILDSFERDRPKILRGLLDTAAAILQHLPTVQPSRPERLFAFSKWLAAFERADGVPAGVFQMEFSSSLNEGMLDALLEDPVASAVLDLLDRVPDASWTGTPSALLAELDDVVGRRATFSAGWPKDASALSKRLRSLEAGLLRQGVRVSFGRGRERTIAIARESGGRHV